VRNLFWIALPLASAGSLSAASGELTHPCGAAGLPSTFDYIVLASLADSQRPISIATYCPEVR
jgi:hypothetical protein